MNAIQILERVYLYMDTTRNARFQFIDYNKAVNDAIEKFIIDQFGDEAGKNTYSFQGNQQVRDNLYTLIKSTAPTVTTGATITTNYGAYTPNHIANPSDYFYFISLQTLIGGITGYARPTTYNELLPLLEDSFKQPTNNQPYYLEDATGYTIYRGTTGTLTTATLTYVKTPATYSCGTNEQLIDAGVGVLSLGDTYTCTEVSFYNLVTYQPGDTFTVISQTTLTSGQVILSSNTTTCDLPEKVHNDIAKLAAAILSGTVADYNRSAFADKEAKEA